MTDHAVVLLGERAAEALAVAMRQIGLPVRPLGTKAAEVHLDKDRAFRVARALAAQRGYDAAAVPLEGREKSVLVADMDATIIGQESLDVLAAAYGFGRQVAAITEKAMAGEIEFDEALRIRVKLLKGQSLEDAASILKRKITINDGAEILVRTMAARGARCALVTGGFDVFAGPVAERLGFHDVFANRLRSADGVLTGDVAEPILGRSAKEEALLRVCGEAGLSPAAASALGDGANDRAMIEKAGLGVGYRAKAVLAKAADVNLRHADLTAVLSLQGIPENEWWRPDTA
jgi:phosphoserine phosphatase